MSIMGKFPGQWKNSPNSRASGTKTANVVLGVAYEMPVGIVVDTHVARLSFRLGLTTSKSPVEIERDLQELVPKSEWIHLAHLLIFHGRQICKAMRPQCEKCFMNQDCPKRGVKLTPKKA